MLPYNELEDLLNNKFEQFNEVGFIKDDPISIPRSFKKKEDIEISGFFASILAWGQRKTIINKCHALFELMDNSPFDFIMNHEEHDLKRFETFKHRTFNSTDTLYFIEAIKVLYTQHGGLQGAFSKGLTSTDKNVKNAIRNFQKTFFSLEDYPQRIQKHVSSPLSNSACKRINMYLRWMVRKDEKGVDFGLWDTIHTSQLVCPCDVHVERVAKKLGLATIPKVNWKMAEEITDNLKQFDPEDPVKYDFALFGLGIEKYFDIGYNG
ncbi:MAG: TIGR02757 family protein [Cytophagales bacterium]|nr:TIGR02757 family protein [Cytophagales bacterium]